ncbi:MAG: hypothetical protein UU25_C0012G0002 [Microgenomates group bacterium GW2011_GWB1_40_9]|uniref:Uncharacterized protein n=1 Tax=Candidatus Amesbacteria bacterium GW2011_GWC1_47_15 TaxID=1618364 RepID=A0A0G1S2K7_9BACT|nr:MAG: hypothetical protein UU25_C0012G0002 [Microgenomates group bacterium GW2011_GWB1_40_9]KKU63591.1 MAG: hypothetical protein UX86_C0021G0002 [Candidatus Amesbacteria bacterium GW2011_GWC1_47_15]
MTYELKLIERVLAFQETLEESARIVGERVDNELKHLGFSRGVYIDAIRKAYEQQLELAQELARLHNQVFPEAKRYNAIMEKLTTQGSLSAKEKLDLIREKSSIALG